MSSPATEVETPPTPRVPRALAWHVLTRQRTRFVITNVDVAIATLLMVFQGSLIWGFASAARKTIDVSDADIWILPRGVRCFEFSGVLPEGFADIASGLRGVKETFFVASGFTHLKRPDGGSLAVVVVGAEEAAGAGYPRPALNALASSTLPQHFSAEATTASLLGIGELPASVEIGGRRGVVSRLVRGFGTFMGSPYVYGDYRDAKKMLRIDASSTSFIAVRVREGAAVEQVAADLRAALPEADVLTADTFGSNSAVFWLMQTGAGGGFVVAALLGLVVGVVVVSQTLQTTTLEHLKEYAVLKVLGATGSVVRRVVLMQALIAGVLGTALGMALSVPVVKLASVTLVSWIATPGWLPFVVAWISIGVAVLSSLTAVRRAVAADAQEVLRG